MDQRARSDEIDLDELRQRNGLLRQVVRAVRDEQQPESALAAILTTLSFELAATGGTVLRHAADGRQMAAARWGVKLPAAALPAIRAALAHDRGVTLGHGGTQFAAQAVIYRGETAGALLLWRGVESAAFDAFDRSLLADVADHLGVVLAQIDACERIDQLSRTDHLTGLANRAAFFDEIVRRFSRLDGRRPAVALLYVDVLKLKVVNTLRGPDAGDAVLVALAGLLRDHTRPGDLIARFGAGEFVLWIDRIDAAGARARATALEAAATRLAPFGVSVGVATLDPLRTETASQLVLRAAADAARAKEKGGGPWPASLPA